MFSRLPILCAAWLGLSAASAHALGDPSPQGQGERRAATPAEGYVVKTDSDTIYLDQGEASGVRIGQEFTVFVAKGELKHPVTGESLGPLENPVARGRIEQIFPKYSTGRLLVSDSAKFRDVKPGQRVRLKAAAAPPSPTAPAAAPSDESSRQPVWRSPALDLEAVGLTLADVDGDAKTDLVVADSSRVLAYPYAARVWDETSAQQPWKPSCRFEESRTGSRILSVDASDMDNDGKAEIFVTAHNSFLNRVETHVLECLEGTFSKRATLSWMTRAYEDENGKWRLAGQQLIDDPTFPFGRLYPLEFKDGKYSQGGSAIRFKRVEWVYGFTVLQEEASTDPAQPAQPFPVFYTATHRLRAQFPKGAWVSQESYGQTSNRVRWHEKLLMFSPRPVTLRDSGRLTGFYTLRNIPSLGALANAFGVYGSAELHKLRWTGLSFEPEWKADLGGYAADLATSSTDAAAAELFIAVVSKAGKTSVWKFVP